MDASARALVTELARRSSVAWVRYGEPEQERAAWYAWHDDALLLVAGGAEQPLPGLDGARSAVVTLRSKATRHAAAVVAVDVEVVDPGDSRWTGLAEALRPARLNAPRDVVTRWAASSWLLRLVPTTLLAGPGEQPDDDRRAAPPPSPADTASADARQRGSGPGRRRRRPPATPPLTG